IFAIVPALIRFSDRHRVLLKAVYENRGEGNFIDRVVDYLYAEYHEVWEQQNPELSKKAVEFLFFYVVSGLVGIIGHWLFNEPKMSVDEVIEQAGFLLHLTTPQIA
ncbi:MAG: TetR family transcriptional regulator C-terminal domain-containing protein, partial [Coriobacteriia bacterium]|nr:TetR family transcriptional regulator C-terminal domain-containing protein [Coriobacteriia bacterium]